MNQRPRLYFSFRSPYSWLAVRRLRRSMPDLFEVVDFFPYWQPDEQTGQALAQRGGAFHYTEMSRAKHLYLLMDVKRLVEREGLSIVWPIDVRPWWEPPHLAWLLAQRAGRGEAFYDALVTARWGGGQNICDPSVIETAAVRAGVDPGLAIRAPENPGLREEAVECLYQAHLDSVFGVPYLKSGRHRFWGVDRMDAFGEMWRPPSREVGAKADRENPTDGGWGAEALWSGIPATLMDESHPYESDCVGGCG